jgi:putative transposase
LPWHGPPHYAGNCELYLITAACYEHKPVIGLSSARIAEFEAELLQTAETRCQQIFAWTVLPNHYHLLVQPSGIKGLLGALGTLHGRTAHRWNGQDACRGRHVWHRAAETAMRSERHFWASLNYVLHNAVRHRYVERWQDWPYSNAAVYLAEVGRDEAERRWREYPLLDYGNDWDPPEM